MADKTSGPSAAPATTTVGQRLNRFRNLAMQGVAELSTRPASTYVLSAYYVEFDGGPPVLRHPDREGPVAITPEALTDLATMPRVGALDIVFTESSCIDLRFKLPSALLPEMQAIIDNETQFRSPFSEGASLWFWRAEELPDSSWQAKVAVTLKAPVDKLLTQLVEHDLKVGVVRREADGAHLAAFPLWAGGGRPSRTGWLRQLPSLLKFSLAGAIIFCVAAAALSVKNGARQSALRVQADAARAQISYQAQIGASIRQVDAALVQSADKLAMAGVLSNLLPDGVWLDQLVVDDDTVTLIGFAPSAAEVTRILTQVPQLSDIRFASPVTRDNTQSLERFRIAASLVGPQS